MAAISGTEETGLGFGPVPGSTAKTQTNFLPAAGWVPSGAIETYVAADDQLADMPDQPGEMMEEYQPELVEPETVEPALEGYDEYTEQTEDTGDAEQTEEYEQWAPVDFSGAPQMPDPTITQPPTYWANNANNWPDMSDASKPPNNYATIPPSGGGFSLIPRHLSTPMKVLWVVLVIILIVGLVGLLGRGMHASRPMWFSSLSSPF